MAMFQNFIGFVVFVMYQARCADAQVVSRFPGLAGPGALRPPPQAYDEHYRAYSAALLPGRQRDNVSYGGKSQSSVLEQCTFEKLMIISVLLVIMPPSALARLCEQ
jgi:hypothetical protein